MWNQCWYTKSRGLWCIFCGQELHSSQKEFTNPKWWTSLLLYKSFQADQISRLSEPLQIHSWAWTLHLQTQQRNRTNSYNRDRQTQKLTLGSKCCSSTQQESDDDDDGDANGFSSSSSSSSTIVAPSTPPHGSQIPCLLEEFNSANSI